MNRSSSFRTRAWLTAATVFWLAGVVYGIERMSRYALTPAVQQPLVPTWPAISSLARAPGRTTLVMFVHPQCPCTRASLAELEQIIRENSGTPTPALDAFVVFLAPSSMPQGWAASTLLDRVGHLRGVSVVSDTNGREARLFHADVSGVLVLYDGRGDLMFSGGITGSRGEVGENDGLRRVRALLTASPTSPQRAPVFGCPLSDPAARTDGAL
ncbi:MAG: RedB protein [Vicinamibacterales bacterium]